MNSSKIEKYLKLAEFQAELFSKDPKKKVAALVVDDKYNIRSTGFNGFPRGFEETTERWEKPKKYDYVVHAEANAVCSAARNGASLDRCTLVTTMFPCNECAKLIIQAGISRIISRKPKKESSWLQSFEKSLEMFDECGVDVEYL
ncbi:dCMP deaminase [Paramecium bursaria Chlorella virus NE-JV-1]|nr:dCMP deaminase [Paramecium bursaria Chlorella virus NE-JV-1]